MRAFNICIKEHSKWFPSTEDLHNILNKNDVCFESPIEDTYMGTPHLLGIKKVTSSNRTGLEASMYIGADWIVDKQLSVTVLPKFENTDFLRMFITALDMDAIDISYLEKCYGIHFNAEPIWCPKLASTLSPLIVIQYISLLNAITKKGLRKNYIKIEENLKSKVKGKIVLTTNLRKNTVPGRNERFWCSYQLFSEDTLENRLLKRALKICSTFLLSQKTEYRFSYGNVLQRLTSAFKNVTDSTCANFNIITGNNKIYKEYSSALRLAKLILRYFSNSITSARNEFETVPPFWIDMPRLYEFYVLSELRKNDNHKINFQVQGHNEVADFVDKGHNIILDAKYKNKYARSSTEFFIEDIREISSYARDTKILPDLKEKNNFMPICFIIHPLSDHQIANEPDIPVFNEFIPLEEQGLELKQFYNFRRLIIPLPLTK